VLDSTPAPSRIWQGFHLHVLSKYITMDYHFRLFLTVFIRFEQAPFHAVDVAERSVRIPRVQVTYDQGFGEGSPLATYVWKYRDIGTHLCC